MMLLPTSNILFYTPALLQPSTKMGKSSFRDLVAWQKAMQLSTSIHSISQRFPRDERFGLTQQIRRAAVSVPSNIAEGRGRGTSRDYRRFLMQARGSACEVQTQLLIAGSLGYLASEAAEIGVSQSEEVIRLISGLIRYLDSRDER